MSKRDFNFRFTIKGFVLTKDGLGEKLVFEEYADAHSQRQKAKRNIAWAGRRYRRHRGSGYRLVAMFEEECYGS